MGNRKRSKKYGQRTLINAFILCLLGLFVTGCTWGNADNAEESGEKKVILLGKESYVNSDVSFLNGIEMAMDEWEKTETNHQFTWEHMDDGGEYEAGLLCGEQAAADASVLAVLTFQDFDVLEALAPIYEEYKKPLISVQGCYESTLEKGCDYFFSAFTSAGDMGGAMADYCYDMGYDCVALSHTDTEFELEEMRGFQKQADKNGVNVVDLVQGPNNMAELKSICYQWKRLGIKAVYLAQLTYSDTAWMLEMIEYLKQEMPELAILSDYSLNKTSLLKAYGEILEDVVITAPYSVEESRKLQSFAEQYKKCFRLEATNIAVQSYDLFMMFNDYLNTGQTQDLKTWMKQKHGYDGVTGRIIFNEQGKLTGIQPQYLKVSSQTFEVVSNFRDMRQK